jgi:hypothetical protein
MDHEARIVIPVSRWKLAEIGWACFRAAISGKAMMPRQLHAESISEPPPMPEAPLEPPAEAKREETPEDQWERLMTEIRDLSR